MGQPPEPSGDPESRFEGPPIFTRPTPDELPPAEKPWQSRLGRTFLALGVVVAAIGVLGLLARSGGILQLAVGVASLVAGTLLVTANGRAVRAWRAVHEPDAR